MASESKSTPTATLSVKAPPKVDGAVKKPKIGEWNHFELCVGKRGFGKSYKMLQRMVELDKIAGGAYKLGHSMGQRFPTEAVPTLQIRYHDSIQSLDRWMRREPDDFHVLTSEDADELVQYAAALGKAVKKHALGFFRRNKTPLGIEATPIIVAVDEMVALTAARGSAQGSNSGQWFRRMLISLRHDHVALLAGIQDSNAISYINAGLATQVHCFRTTHEWALNSLRASGMPKEQIAQLSKLGVGESITIDG